MRKLVITIVAGLLILGCAPTMKNIYYEKDGNIFVGIEQSKWLVSIPSGGLKKTNDGFTRPGYFIWENGPDILSVIIETASMCTSAVSCRNQSMDTIKKVDPDSHGQKSWENGDYALSEFLSGRQGERRLHLNKHAVRDGFWYDIHFSKSNPSNSDEVKAIEYLDNIRLVQNLLFGYSTTGNITTNDSSTSAIEKAHYYVNLGKSFAQKRDFNNAKINFLKAAELDPSDYENWGLVGMAAKDNSQFDEAIRYFQKAIEVKPSDYRAYGQIGLVSMRLRKYEDAISAFKAVLSLNSTDLEAAARLAEIYYEKGDYVQCEQNMTRFEENLSKINVSLLSDQTKKAIEKTLNAFVNYRAVIKGKTSSNKSERSL